MLGYDIDFGHFEFISLISSSKYQEKAVGYMAVSLLLRPGDELFTLGVNSMRNDLVSPFNYHQCLALATVANIGGSELAEALASDVAKLVISPSEVVPAVGLGQIGDSELRNKTMLCKKSSLCLLRFFRDNPDCIVLDEWVRKCAKLLEDRDVGVVLCGLSLVHGLASHEASIFEPLIAFVISVLTRLVIERTCSVDYLYYRTPTPWAVVKCLRILQLYKYPQKEDGRLLKEVLTHILEKTEVTDNVNKSNSDHAVLFEAVNLIISYGGDVDPHIKDASHRLLGRFIETKDANVRYLGLDAMSKLARLDGPDAVKSHQMVVVEALLDLDVSVRKRALDLLFVMSDESNAIPIVAELITNLSITDANMKELIVVKVAILAEKFTRDWKWYVDTLCKVILVAGDHVAEAVWHRIVHVVTNHADIHEYAAVKMFETAQNKFANEVSVSLAAYLLGEIGVNICERPGMSGYDQFACLHQHFAKSHIKLQAILLTTYAKLMNLYPDTRDFIGDVFTKYSTSGHLELQQRSCEYLELPKLASEVMETALNTMPPFAANKENNSLFSLLNGEKEKENKPLNVGSKKAEISQSSSTKSHDSTGSSTSSVTKQDNTPKIDLLSLDDDEITIPGTAVGIPAEVLPKLKQMLKDAIITPVSQKCILYEDDILRITIISDYKVHQGRIAFALYNKTGADLVDFKLTVADLPHLAFRVQDPAHRIPASGEGRAQIAVECKRPFVDEAPFDVSFSVGQAPYKYPLKLPVVPSCFFEPIPTDKETYMARWKAISGEGLEVQEVFPSSKPVTPQLVQHLRINVVPNLHIGIAAGLDNEYTITSCASFRTGTAGADGNMIAIGVLMRLEGNAAQNCFRITVRAKHPMIAQAMKNIVKSLLS